MLIVRECVLPLLSGDILQKSKWEKKKAHTHLLRMHLLGNDVSTNAHANALLQRGGRLYLFRGFTQR